MKITEIDDFHPGLTDSIYRLLRQLTDKQLDFSDDALRLIIESPNSHLLVATEDDELVGMLTIATYISPTGKKAWIEDVVVEATQRGGGLGRALVEHAIGYCREVGIDTVYLTSNPKRVAANALYQSVGFGRKETNMYKMDLTK